MNNLLNKIGKMGLISIMGIVYLPKTMLFLLTVSTLAIWKLVDLTCWIFGG